MTSMRYLLSLFAGLIFVATVSAQSDDGVGSFGIEWGTGQVICTGDSDDADASSDPSYARAAAWDRRVLGAVGKGCGQLTPLDGGTWGASEPFKGRDSQGLSADFRLYVLHDRYAWQLGSATRIEDDGAPANLAAVLETPEFRSRFCAAKAAFSVGAASHEGPTEPNHRLAEARAEAVITRLRDVRAGCPAGSIPILYAINLGEHQNRCVDADRCADSSAAQRRVIMVAAEDLALGVNLEEALRQGIETQDVFRDVSVDDYDLFNVAAY